MIFQDTGGAALFLQIAETLKNDILKGIISEEMQVPSTNELARAYQINPATAGRGINLLVSEGILYKKRGIGMFVAQGAKQIILEKRREIFTKQTVKDFCTQAKTLGIEKGEIVEIITKNMEGK